MKPANIYQRINAVMKEVSYVKKSDKKVNGQYSFVSHDSVVAALQGPLVNNGIALIPTVADLKQDGNRTVVCMEISLVNIDDPTDRVVVTHYGYGIDTQDKGIGKAVSYAVKYALLKLFCLETGDDVEKDSIEYKPAENPKAIEEIQAKVLERKNQIAEIAGKENLEDLKKYINKLKESFKTKKEEELILAKDASLFVEDFYKWKEKHSKVA